MSGQPFLHLLRWHPRDVDTLQQIYEDRAADSRLDAARAHALTMMGGAPG